MKRKLFKGRHETVEATDSTKEGTLYNNRGIEYQFIYTKMGSFFLGRVFMNYKNEKPVTGVENTLAELKESLTKELNK